MTQRAIGRRYRIVEELAQGGQYIVRLAQDLLLNECVVLKESVDDELQTIRNEHRALSLLRHPNLVQGRGLLASAGHLYLIQTYAPGLDFVAWARRDPAPERLCLGIAAVLRGLQYMHVCGWVHRDIKPANIRVDDAMLGSLPAARLLDFGLASFDPPRETTGTKGYIAPEVLSGEPATAASDLYSLGALLFEAVTGRPPGLEVTAGGASIPDRLSDVLGMLPSAKGESHHVVAELLAALLDPEPQHRPDATTLFDSLGHVVGRSLQIGREELATDYFPQPPLIAGDEQLGRLRQMMERVKQGGRVLLHLTGGHTGPLAAEICAMAHLAGILVLEVDSTELLSRISEIDGDVVDADRLATRIVDELLTAAPAAQLIRCHDLDPAEPLTVALMTQLTRDRAEGCFVLWEGALPGQAAPPWQELRIPKQSPEEMTRLVRGMLYHLPDELPWLDQVYATTGGDPALAIELVRSQIGQGLPDKLVDLPALDVREAQRLDALDQTQQKLLAIIAHAPGPVPPAVVSTAAPDVTSALGGLLARGALALSAQGVAPSNTVLRSCAQQLYQGRRLQQLHGRLADAWATVGGADPAVLGHHLLRSGQVEAAASHLLEARAPRQEDLELITRQLPPGSPTRPAILARLARIVRASGGLDRALDLADAVAAMDPDSGAVLRAELLLDAGQPAQALGALEKLEASTDAIHLMRARSHILLGDFSEAAGAAEAGLEQETTSPRRRVQLENVMGLSWVYLDRAVEGLAVLRGAEQTARAHGELEALARVLNSTGIALQRLGRHDEAASAYEECIDRFRRQGDLRLAATCSLNLGTLLHRQMDLAPALAHYRKAGQLAQRGALGTTGAWAAANEGNLLLLFGDTDQAEAKLELALQLARREGGRSLIGHILLYQADLHRSRGQLDAAHELLRRAGAEFEPSDRPGNEAADIFEAELQLARRDLDGARASSERLLARLDPDRPEHLRAALLGGRAALAQDPPDVSRAAEILELACRQAQGRHAPERTWEHHGLLAHCYDQLEQAKQAASHRQQATRLLSQLRAQIPPPQRHTFDARPEVQTTRRLMEAVDRDRDVHPPQEGVLRLLDINKELNQGLELDLLLDRILDGAIELLGAERGFVLLQRGDRLRLAASRNVDREPVRRAMAKFSQSIAEQVLDQGAPVVVADASADDRFRRRLSVSGLKLRAVLCVPLLVRDEVRGVLYLDNRFGTGIFDRNTVALAQAFADQAGIALENTRLLQEAAKQREELAEAKAQVEALNHQLEAQVARQSQALSEISVRLQHQEEELIRRYNAAHLIGRSKVMHDLFVQLDRVAEADVPVVIYGESGTGKELAARAIHHSGPRADRPFVAVNCGAIPTTLLESELFGYVRGAFTGAERDRPGVFEITRDGTLLLDEVGDMNPQMQVKLLRILQEGTYRRLGDRRERTSRCRVLAASHRRLDDLVSQGAFREDLFYRLQVIRIDIPPLRKRREDIPLLVQHFLTDDEGKAFQVSPLAMRALVDFDWPGNVRQLENELKRACLLGDKVIELADLSPEVRGSKETDEPEDSPSGGLRDALRDHERRLIQATLIQTGFNVSQAAEHLQLHRVVLHRRMRALGISRKQV